MNKNFGFNGNYFVFCKSNTITRSGSPTNYRKSAKPAEEVNKCRVSLFGPVQFIKIIKPNNYIK